MCCGISDATGYLLIVPTTLYGADMLDIPAQSWHHSRLMLSAYMRETRHQSVGHDGDKLRDMIRAASEIK